MGTAGGLLACRYRLDRVSGRGAAGVVWHAVDELIGREVAVKELRPATDGVPGIGGPARALREARALGRISHPGVIGIHDVVTEDDTVYLVVELVRAPALESVLSEGPLSPERVEVPTARLLDVLAAAHGHGVVHRDVKPGNVMLLPGDEVKLVDFGIALTARDERLTREGVLGSTGYLAPELFDGGEPSAASDLWALGVTLYQALTGVTPFERGTEAATLHAILFADPPPLPVTGRLADVITGLLTRPVERRLTASAAVALLRRTEAWDPRATTVSSAPRRPGEARYRVIRPHPALVVSAAALIVALSSVVLVDLVLSGRLPWWTLVSVVLPSAVAGGEAHLRHLRRWWDTVEVSARGVVLSRTGDRRERVLPWPAFSRLEVAKVRTGARLTIGDVRVDVARPAAEVVRDLTGIAPPGVLVKAGVATPVPHAMPTLSAGVVFVALVRLIEVPAQREPLVDSSKRYTALGGAARADVVVGVADDRTVAVLRTRTAGAVAETFRPRGGPVDLIAVSTDGTTFASSGPDGTTIHGTASLRTLVGGARDRAAGLALDEHGRVAVLLTGEPGRRVIKVLGTDRVAEPVTITDRTGDVSAVRVVVPPGADRVEVVGVDTAGGHHTWTFTDPTDLRPGPARHRDPPADWPGGPAALTEDGRTWVVPAGPGSVRLYEPVGFTVPPGDSPSARSRTATASSPRERTEPCAPTASPPA
ncbi:hypothetical protein GCM10022243_67220 [Saccharothrix violaceirubra]|uniref:non-specific serine/threonine protein kinase n=1 Tax=Saccharothrix violaceirubra TaxID=413306 RepID=A0A7W7WVQ3_9PSEU|nr:serine/threonine-protein kinase [Saccharothrix violaceirubra]MBB4965326.1 hypothetical protein [Saccharothrix violaceirubra]